MADENKTIDQSTNKGTVRGILTEKKWEVIDDKIKDGTPSKLLRGNITVTTDSSVVKFGFYQHDKFNSGKDNFKYKNLMTALQGLISKEDAVSSNSEADTVYVDYTTRVNDYYHEAADTVKTSINYDIDSLGRSLDDEPNTAEGVISGIVTGKVPEIISEEETGRLKVTIATITYSQEAQPYDIFVSEELANDFDSMYEVGDSGEFDYEIVTTHVGKSNTVSTGLGRKAKVQSGFDRTEWVLIGASEPFEEDIKGYLNKEEVKPLLENRKIKLEDIKKTKGGKGNKVKTGGGLKNAKVASDIPDSELPF